MKKLGFGCMRLPMLGGAEGQVDQAQFNEMIDRYLAEGFCYFDTAHVYLQGKSELAMREGLVKRHPRDSFLLTDKLSGSCFEDEAGIQALFDTQLAALGTDYFDYYLMHALTAQVYEKFERCHAFETVARFVAEGKVRHMGISFHDKPAVLERILTEHPEIEVVQIQLNYLDIDDPSVESGEVYEVCHRFGKPVLVMEPVKGGALADLGDAGQNIFDALHGGSPASYAIRYAASFPDVFMVLSGMSNVAQMEDNLSYMKEFRPLDDTERAAVEQVRRVLKAQDMIPCTGCRYCEDGCPKHILIPDLFSCMNTKKKYSDWNSDFYYEVHTQNHGKASDCIRCRRCEKICPQHLPITDLLPQVTAAFETEE